MVKNSERSEKKRKSKQWREGLSSDVNVGKDKNSVDFAQRKSQPQPQHHQYQRHQHQELLHSQSQQALQR